MESLGPYLSGTPNFILSKILLVTSAIAISSSGTMVTVYILSFFHVLFAFLLRACAALVALSALS